MGIALAEAMGIKAKAEGHEISQADIARRFKVTPPTVSQDWLKKGRIAKKHYPTLIEYFGLPYEWWFGPAATDARIGRTLGLMLQMSPKGRDETVKAAEKIQASHPNKKQAEETRNEAEGAKAKGSRVAA